MKRVLKGVGLMLLLLVIYYLAQTVVTLVFGIIFLVSGGAASLVPAVPGVMPDVEAIMSEMLGFISRQTPWILLLSVVLSLPFYYLLYRKRQEELWTFVRIQPVDAVALPALIFLGFSLNIVIDILVALIGQIGALHTVFEQYDALGEVLTGGSVWWTLLAVGIVAPIFEEILFRGLIFGELRKLMPIRLALVIQALAFGIYHLNVVQSTYAVVIGLALGFVYYRSNSIVSAILVHITVNSTSILLFQLVPAEQFDRFAVLIVCAGVALLVISSVFIFLHKSFRHTMDNSLYHNSRQTPPYGPSGDVL
ncbi:CPBP family intramembrane glutamic endopeptidase [Oscillospiraceae bacterium WX1]